ncbi:MAG TPA: SBBP repeat-containing protein, partial [Bryobacteraceae bacterium]|nr:SBBP repeat-containing protein [Bryobacteraceae bacterium]
MRALRIPWIALIANGAALAAGSGQSAIPLFFIANHGQAPRPVQFMAKASGLTAYFLRDEVLWRSPGTSVYVRFEGAAPSAVEGAEPLATKANFLTGSSDQWRLQVPVFGQVVYRDLYPGIDMIYRGCGHDLKSEFVVAPGADPTRIRFRYENAGRLRIEEDGALVIPLEGRNFLEHAPLIYQERDGFRSAVKGRFVLSGNGTVSFLVGAYDASRPLIIDPVLSYSTLLGGSGFDTATAITVDAAGAAYVAGYTDSFNFPTANPEQNFNAGGNDVFVAKLNPTGNGLAYCTYIGGSGDDRAYGIVVDSSGSAYVTGSTTSTNFPTRNAVQSKLQGWRNAFVLRLSPAGNLLTFSTYLGGYGSDNGNGIAVDSGGNAYVVGDTTSVNFPATAFQKGFRGVQDAFVTKISPDGSRLLYSTYVGGANADRGTAIAVDSSGSAYITGSTYSSDFPTMNAFQRNIAGGGDAFITRLSADGNSLLFSTYLGGSGGTVSYPETGQGIALDSQGNVYVVGVTSSLDFPLLEAVQASRLGATDAFVTKVNSAGALVYSTYLGGSSIEVGNAIAVDQSGAAYVVGYTYSSDLPVTAGALQATNAGDCDAFVAKLSPTGNSLAYLSYLGGSSSDTATAVTLDPNGNVYVTGWTLSTNFPLLNAFQSTNAGNYGAFVTKLGFAQLPSVLGVTPNSGIGTSQTFSFQYSDPNGATDLVSVSALFNSTLTTVSGCAVTYNRAQNTLSLLTDAGAQPSGSITPGSSSQQNSQCTLNGSASSVSVSGTVLTLNLALTFQGSFAGTKNIYMQATNPSGTANWQQEGTWTVAPPPQVSKLSCIPTSLGSGASSTCTVTLNRAAPSDGTSVSLASNNALLTIPASVTVTAGSTSAAFNAASGTVASSQSATVTATLGSSSQSAAISLVAQGSATSVSIWSSSVVPGNPWYNASPLTLGLKFRSDVTGTITGIRFYKGAGNTGTHIGLLYSSSGTLLGQATFINET